MFSNLRAEEWGATHDTIKLLKVVETFELLKFLKENGLILNQELNSIKHTRRRWSDRILETER